MASAAVFPPGSEVTAASTEEALSSTVSNLVSRADREALLRSTLRLKMASLTWVGEEGYLGLGI